MACALCRKGVFGDEISDLPFSFHCEHRSLICFSCLDSRVKEQLGPQSPKQCPLCHLPSMPLLLHALHEAVEQAGPHSPRQRAVRQLARERCQTTLKPWNNSPIPFEAVAPLAQFFLRHWQAAVRAKWPAGPFTLGTDVGTPDLRARFGRLLNEAHDKKKQCFEWHNSTWKALHQCGRDFQEAFLEAMEAEPLEDRDRAFLDEGTKGIMPVWWELRSTATSAWFDPQNSPYFCARLLDLHLCGWTAKEDLLQWFLTTKTTSTDLMDWAGSLEADIPNSCQAHGLRGGAAATWTTTEFYYLLEGWIYRRERERCNAMATRLATQQLIGHLFSPPPTVDRAQWDCQKLFALFEVHSAGSWDAMLQDRPSGTLEQLLGVKWPGRHVLPLPAPTQDQQYQFTDVQYQRILKELKSSYRVKNEDLPPAWDATTSHLTAVARRWWLAVDRGYITSALEGLQLAIRLGYVWAVDQPALIIFRLENLLDRLLPTQLNEYPARIREALYTSGDGGPLVAVRVAYEWIVRCTPDQRALVNRAVTVTELLLFHTEPVQFLVCDGPPEEGVD